MSCGGHLKIIVSIVAFILSMQAQAADLSDTEIYAKCHARLSDHPVDIDSADYKKVEAGTLDPVAACKKILDRTTFKKVGARKLIPKQSDPVAVSTLRNLNEFHKSWFAGIGEIQSALDGGLYNFVDHTEPALFITDALFGGLHYRSIFTRRSSIRGVRRKPAGATNYVVRNTNYKDRKLFSGPIDPERRREAKADNIEIAKFDKVDIGYLVGIEPTPTMSLRERETIHIEDLKESQWPSLSEDTQRANIALNYGGGILGSAAYINSNREGNTRLDGGVRVHRRMANNTFYDLMCLTMPTLNNNDIKAYTNKYKASKLSFRKGKTCIQCHATLDPFADVARNLFTMQSSSNIFRRDIQKVSGLSGALDVRYVKRYKVRTNKQSIADKDNIYHRRAPRGALFYRNYDGKLVNKNVNGLAQMGAQIAAQDDIYMCAAQRYYHFLTGVNISVAHKSTDTFYKKHRSQIVKMGKSFKGHGSLKRLILDILKSDAFKTRAPNLDLVKGGE